MAASRTDSLPPTHPPVDMSPVSLTTNPPAPWLTSPSYYSPAIPPAGLGRPLSCPTARPTVGPPCHQSNHQLTGHQLVFPLNHSLPSLPAHHTARAPAIPLHNPPAGLPGRPSGHRPAVANPPAQPTALTRLLTYELARQLVPVWSRLISRTLAHQLISVNPLINSPVNHVIHPPNSDDSGGWA